MKGGTSQGGTPYDPQTYEGAKVEEPDIKQQLLHRLLPAEEEDRHEGVSCCGSMQVSIRSSRSMMADVPMCLIIKSTKSSRFRRNSTI
ncbi:hypothetical protein EYF80_049161 [Liparis tanakae]|uniref:Uncharacterized protein n=1 Tax=Liparis tanakae TaxID=230148 RepID=A0A4Z2FHF5_9TELE|nr:hypothetical protein EYF80_049161 [Liparis tanakae]